MSSNEVHSVRVLGYEETGKLTSAQHLGLFLEKEKGQMMSQLSFTFSREEGLNYFKEGRVQRKTMSHKGSDS